MATHWRIQSTRPLHIFALNLMSPIGRHRFKFCRPLITLDGQIGRRWRKFRTSFVSASDAGKSFCVHSHLPRREMRPLTRGLRVETGVRVPFAPHSVWVSGRLIRGWHANVVGSLCNMARCVPILLIVRWRKPLWRSISSIKQMSREMLKTLCLTLTPGVSRGLRG